MLDGRGRGQGLATICICLAITGALLLLHLAPFSAQGRSPFPQNQMTTSGTTLLPYQAYLPLVSKSVISVAAIATSPALPDVIVILPKTRDTPTTEDTWRPLLYSLDGGKHWQQVHTIPKYEEAIDVYLAIAPGANQSTNMLVAVHSKSNAGLYRSGDYGIAWEVQEIPDAVYYDYLIASPAQPRHVYLAASYTVPLIPPFDVGFVLLSQDSGANWSIIREGDPEWYTQVVPSPVLEQRVYVIATRTGWLQSDDLGENWQFKSFPSRVLELDAVNSELLYGPGSRSTDGGETWQMWAEQPAGCEQVLAHPTATRALLARCAQGLYCSADAGDHWEQIASTPGDLLAADHGVPGRVLWARQNELWAGTGACPNFTYLATLPMNQGLPFDH